MTSKKDFKRLVRDRQDKTGESYTAARAQVLAQAPRRGAQVQELKDASTFAQAEGLRCRAVVSDGLWSRVQAGGDPSARLKGVFAKLAELLRSLRGDSGAAALWATLEGGTESAPPASSAVQWAAEARQFTEQARAGVRGVSRTGRVAAWDVSWEPGAVSVMAILMAPPIPTPERAPVLWLSLLDEPRFSDSQDEGWGEQLSGQFALAGLGGPWRGSR